MINDIDNSNKENIFQIMHQGTQSKIMNYVHFKIKKGISS